MVAVGREAEEEIDGTGVRTAVGAVAAEAAASKVKVSSKVPPTGDQDTTQTLLKAVVTATIDTVTKVTTAWPQPHALGSQKSSPGHRGSTSLETSKTDQNK